MERKNFLTRGRFLLWLFVLTLADIVFTYVCVQRYGLNYESNILGSYLIYRFGAEAGFSLLMFLTLGLGVFLSECWKYKLAVTGAWLLLSAKSLLFFWHLFGFWILDAKI